MKIEGLEGWAIGGRGLYRASARVWVVKMPNFTMKIVN